MREDYTSVDELFEAARQEPTEIGLEQIDKMVAGFPLTPAPTGFDWSSIINLNSIIMTSVSAFIIAGSILLYNGSAQNPGQTETETLSSQQQGLIAAVASETEMEDLNCAPIEAPAQRSSGSSPDPEPALTNGTLPNEEPPAEEEPTAEATPDNPIAYEDQEYVIPDIPEPMTPEPEEEERTVIALTLDTEAMERQVEQAMEEAFETMTEELQVMEWAVEQSDCDEYGKFNKAFTDDYDYAYHYDGSKEDRRDYDLSGFTGVSVAGSFDVTISQGSQFKVWAEGDSEQLDKIEIKMSGNDLDIGMKKKKDYRGREKCNSYHSCANVQVYVEMPSFDDISVAGSGDLTIHSFTGLGSVDFSVAGSGSIDASGSLEMNGTVDCSIAGSGEMNIDGTADKVEVSIAGSGDFAGLDLRARSADISIAGSGSVGIHAEERLDVSIAGSGDVEYLGSPNVNKSIMGSGNISRH